jgi:hypothetical protein
MRGRLHALHQGASVTRPRLKSGHAPEGYPARLGPTLFRHARYIANAKTNLSEVVSERWRDTRTVKAQASNSETGRDEAVQELAK